MKKDLFFSIINDHSFVYGFSGKYELMVSDLDGHLLYKIHKDAPNRKFPIKAMKEVKKAELGRLSTIFLFNIYGFGRANLRPKPIKPSLKMK